MEKINIKLKEGECSIIIGENSLSCLETIINGRKTFFVIDKFLYENFYDEYFIDVLKNYNKEDIYLLESMEKNKDINTALKIIEKLNERNHLRDSLIVGIGGGVIGDVVGFVSSIYMRGIKFINIPTTLLAQIDSSIGGKNALNIYNGKNLIGTFNHPEKIIIYTKFLNTLTKREIVSGLAEAIKYGIVFENSFLEYIDKNLEEVFKLNSKVIQNIIVKSCEFKAKVVEKDEKDFFIRKVLNHGHTIGHAIESVTNYNLYTHGEAVLIGMFYEACISYECGFMDEKYFDYITNVLKKFNVNFNRNIFESELFYEALLRDKKNRLDKISFILPTKHSKVLEYMFLLEELKKIDYMRYCF